MLESSWSNEIKIVLTIRWTDCGDELLQVHPRKIFVVENHVEARKEEISIQIGVKSEETNRLNGVAHPWDTQMNSVSKIDIIARIVFPALFLTINLFYWYVYLVPSQWQLSRMKLVEIVLYFVIIIELRTQWGCVVLYDRSVPARRE